MLLVGKKSVTQYSCSVLVKITENPGSTQSFLLGLTFITEEYDSCRAVHVHVCYTFRSATSACKFDVHV